MYIVIIKSIPQKVLTTREGIVIRFSRKEVAAEWAEWETRENEYGYKIYKELE